MVQNRVFLGKINNMLRHAIMSGQPNVYRALLSCSNFLRKKENQNISLYIHGKVQQPKSRIIIPFRLKTKKLTGIVRIAFIYISRSPQPLRCLYLRFHNEGWTHFAKTISHMHGLKYWRHPCFIDFSMQWLKKRSARVHSRIFYISEGFCVWLLWSVRP